MGEEKFVEEYNLEVVRTLVKRGYSIMDFFKALGGFGKSLYKWMGTSLLIRKKKNKTELLYVERENPRLRSELAGAQ